MKTIRKWYKFRNRNEYNIGIKLPTGISESRMNKYICVDTCEYCYGFFARDGYIFRMLCTDKCSEDPDVWADMWEPDYKSQLLELLENYNKFVGVC